jgi:hypothetical protein
MTIDNPFLVALAITVIFWAYREVCHLLERARLVSERDVLLGRVLAMPAITTADGRLAPYNPSVGPAPDLDLRTLSDLDAPLTPEEKKREEEMATARLNAAQARISSQQELSELETSSDAVFSDVVRKERPIGQEY